MEESFKFACKYCGQHLRAYDDLTGEEIQCPRCEEGLIVCTRSEACKREGFTAEIERIFSVEEMQLLKHEDRSIFRFTENASSHNCWEFGLAGAMLRARLQPFEYLLTGMRWKQATHTGEVTSHEPFCQALDAKCGEFLALSDLCYGFFLGTLERAMYADSMLVLVELARKSSDMVIKLYTFHQSLYALPLPETEPYPALLEIMKTWSPGCWQSLMDITTQLDAIYNDGLSVETRLQFTCVPPSMMHFLLLRRQLPA
jgi:hypothetical protein